MQTYPCKPFMGEGYGEGAAARKRGVAGGTPALHLLPPVIPAKAGIQRAAVSPAIRNQARIPTSGSPLPSWERARVRVRRALARLCGRDARVPLIHCARARHSLRGCI